MRRSHVTLVSLTAAAVATLGGCGEVDSPAVLDRAQILAVRAAPAQVPAGGAAALDVLIAGPDGDIAPSAVAWTVVAPGVGAVVVDADGGAEYRAPAAVAEPALVGLRVDADIVDGGQPVQLAGEKVITVGVDPAPMPEIDGVLADGRAADDGVAVAVGEVVEVSISVGGDVPATGLTTWHTTCGELAGFREPIATLEALDGPCAGTLYAIYRDDVGGVAWRRVPVTITAP